MSDEEKKEHIRMMKKEHIRMIFSASYYPFKNIDALVNHFYSWHQQELERAVYAAYRKGYKSGWSTGDSGGRTTKREEVKAKREAWISKEMKEGQS